ncbi:MAG: hypothetical protein ACTSRG_21555 [Candidatus Helarchaeota archaeon]
MKKSGREVKQEINIFLDLLKYDSSLEDLYKILKKRFKMYENELYITYDNEFVPRTNNNLEDFNNCLKRPIRKRTRQARIVVLRRTSRCVRHLLSQYFKRLSRCRWRQGLVEFRKNTSRTNRRAK